MEKDGAEQVVSPFFGSKRETLRLKERKGQGPAFFPL